SAEFTIGEGELMAHDVPLGCAPDEYDDLISGTCSHLPKVGAQKGAFIKMKQENIYIYQRECAVCYVPIIGTIKKINNLA
ncbi:hypothetical protein AB9B89_23900, partial [Escherichia coli]